ncbi:MAG: 50S ribosomal protein L6, partial [Patescibacteria group bacterium]
MSRIGKQLIKVPSGVEVIITPAVLSVRIKVKGPKGELSRDFKNDVVITREGDIFTLKPVSESIFHRALWGTYASHLKNMIEGVTDGFTKRLLIEGIGFKADIIAGKLQMALGY